MSYPPAPAPFGGDFAVAPGAPAQRPPRPWSVSLAVALVAAAVVALLISAAIGVEQLVRTPGLVDEAARSTGATPQEVSEERGIVPALYLIALAVHALMVIVFVGLAIPVWRGNNGARIALCATSGLSSLCCGALLAFSAVLPEQTQRSAFAEELSRLEVATSPAWTYPASVVSALVVTVAPLAALTLLLVPASNRFFRKPPPAGSPLGYHYPHYGYYYGHYGYPTQPAPPVSPPAPPGSPPAPPA